jgi:hypothetical protein
MRVRDGAEDDAQMCGLLNSPELAVTMGERLLEPAARTGFTAPTGSTARRDPTDRGMGAEQATGRWVYQNRPMLADHN